MSPDDKLREIIEQAYPCRRGFICGKDGRDICSGCKKQNAAWPVARIFGKAMLEEAALIADVYDYEDANDRIRALAAKLDEK